MCADFRWSIDADFTDDSIMISPVGKLLEVGADTGLAMEEYVWALCMFLRWKSGKRRAWCTDRFMCQYARLRMNVLFNNDTCAG